MRPCTHASLHCWTVAVQVKGKVNAITLDKSSKTGLVFENVVASCEVVNSQSVEVQCTGLVPTVAIDKVDGCQVRHALTLLASRCCRVTWV